MAFRDGPRPDRRLARYVLPAVLGVVAVTAGAGVARDGQSVDPGRARLTSEAAVRAELIGTWRFVSEWIEDKDGNVVGSAFGGEGAGKLTYTPRGDVWAATGRRHQQIWYTGTFDVRPRARKVVHHVQFASQSDIEGTDLVRRYRLREHRLKLSFALTPDLTGVIVWTRAGARWGFPP